MEGASAEVTGLFCPWKDGVHNGWTLEGSDGWRWAEAKNCRHQSDWQLCGANQCHRWGPQIYGASPQMQRKQRMHNAGAASTEVQHPPGLVIHTPYLAYGPLGPCPLL